MRTLIFGVATVLCAVGCSGTALDNAGSAGAGGADTTISGGAKAGGANTITPDSAGAAGSPASSSQCGKPGDVVTVSSADELKAHLMGRWLYCTGFVLLGVQHEGIEFTSDGQFYFLRYDSDGTLARQKGFDGGGTWDILDTSAFNSPGTGKFVGQIDLTMASGGDGVFAAFQEGPSAMRLSSTGGITDYVAAGD